MSDYGPPTSNYPTYHDPEDEGYVPRRPQARRGHNHPPIDTTDPRQPIAPIRRHAAPRHEERREPSYQDMIVPRIYVEPDEAMDELRARSLRMALIRDVFLILFCMVAIFWLAGGIWSWGS